MFLSTLVGAVAVAALACGSDGSDVPPSSDTTEKKQQPQTPPEQQGRRSLDPTGFDRSCSVDTDCVLVEVVTDCSSCCTGAVAVRDTSELQAARTELGQGCEKWWACAAACFHTAVCTNGLCTKQSADAGADAD